MEKDLFYNHLLANRRVCSLKAHTYEDEIGNETSNDDRWRDVGPHQDQTLPDPNDNV